MKTNRAKIGDIIMSPEFVQGEKHSNGYITVGRKDEFRFRDSTNKNRAKYKYVVEDARMGGGGYGMGPNDTYPDGWEVSARRLNKNDEYNPKGELIHFYQSGCFNCLISEVEIVGQMKRTFVFK